MGSRCRVLMASHDATVRHQAATQPRDVLRRRGAVWCRRPRPTVLQRSAFAVATRPAGRCARPHNATRCGSETSLCAQLSSAPTKLFSTTGKLPPGSRPSAAPRSGQRPSAGRGGPCLGAQARPQMHSEAVLGYAQVEVSSANRTCVVPMGVGNRRVVYQTAGMGASAPRITALLESLRARRPSGLPGGDALEGRRRSGHRAAGRVQRGGAFGLTLGPD